MNHLLIRNLCIALFALGTTVHAQWFYEMGLSRNTYGAFKADNQLVSGASSTEFVPYKGLRDLSFYAGYVFSFSKKDPLEANYRPPLVGLGVAAGFDQMNIRTNAIINNFAYPTNYTLAQLQGRLRLHLTPLVFYSDKSGERKPSFSLGLHGGGAFNQYTSAVRQGANSSVDLINDDPSFKDNYLSYHYGAGLTYYLNDATRLYARYTMEDSEDLVENSTSPSGNVKESYKLYRSIFNLGISMDLGLVKRMKKMQQDKIKALEDGLNDTNNSLNELQAIADANAQMADELGALKDEVAYLKENMIDESTLKTKIHENGVRYFPDFKEIRFKTNSSHFDTKSYAGMLARLGTFLTQNPQLNIQLVGYADMSGSDTYNMQLSKKRAARVRDHLIEKYGVAANRIKTKAMGETNQFSLSDNSDNRRTEIIILE